MPVVRRIHTRRRNNRLVRYIRRYYVESESSSDLDGDHRIHFLDCSQSPYNSTITGEPLIGLTPDDNIVVGIMLKQRSYGFIPEK